MWEGVTFGVRAASKGYGKWLNSILERSNRWAEMQVAGSFGPACHVPGVGRPGRRIGISPAASWEGPRCRKKQQSLTTSDVSQNLVMKGCALPCWRATGIP